MECNFLDIRLFLTVCFCQIVEVKSKTIGCWVRRRHKISILFLYFCVHYRGKPGNYVAIVTSLVQMM